MNQAQGTIKALSWAGSLLCILLGGAAVGFGRFTLLPKVQEVRDRLEVTEGMDPATLDQLISIASWSLWGQVILSVIWLFTLIPVSFTSGRDLVGPVMFLVLVSVSALVLPLIQFALIAISSLVMTPILAP